MDKQEPRELRRALPWGAGYCHLNSFRLNMAEKAIEVFVQIRKSRLHEDDFAIS